MAVAFREHDHSYHSVDPAEEIRWIGATTFVGHFKEPFDAPLRAKKSSKNRKSKWYGLTPDEILEIWDSGNRNSRELGSWYHNQRETDTLSLDTLQRHGRDIPIFKPIFVGDMKHAPEQRLVEGIYPEHFVYLKSAGICGQADRVEVVNGVVDVFDYKTNKEIKREGFTNWEGRVSTLSGPVSHLDDCHFYHYALQLSIYLYIILKHNPLYKPGKLVLHHIVFEVDSYDKYDNPIYKRTPEGDPIVKEIVPIEVPYLRTEVISMIHYLDENRDEILAKKEQHKS